jgi:branched-chain amino acid transport system substrate-binding protein
LAALAFLAFLFPAAAFAAASPTDTAIAVAVVASLRGPQAIAGQDVVDGFSLALKDLGQRFANEEVRITLIDDRGSPDGALQAVSQIVQHQRFDVVLTATSPATLAAILPTLIAAKLFIINTGPVPAPMAAAGCSMWLFDLGGHPDGIHEAAAMQMAADRAKRVVLIGPDMPLTRDAEAAFRRAFPGQVLETLVARHGAADYSEELARIKALAPDAVYDLLTGGMGVDFVRGWEASGLRGKLPLYAAWPGFERVSLAAMGEAALDITTIGIWAPDSDSPLNRRLVTEYELEYGRPATTWSALGYDAAFLLDSALKSTGAKTADTEAVRNGLRRAEFTSVRGVFRFNSNHFPVMTYFARRVGRDAKGRLTNETKAAPAREWRDRTAQACPMRWELSQLPPPPVKKKP